MNRLAFSYFAYRLPALAHLGLAFWALAMVLWQWNNPEAPWLSWMLLGVLAYAAASAAFLLSRWNISWRLSHHLGHWRLDTPLESSWLSTYRIYPWAFQGAVLVLQRAPVCPIAWHTPYFKISFHRWLWPKSWVGQNFCALLGRLTWRQTYTFSLGSWSVKEPSSLGAFRSALSLGRLTSAPASAPSCPRHTPML